MGIPITDEDREKTRLRVKKWRLEHPEKNSKKQCEYARKKYWKDPDKAREKSRYEYLKNTKKCRERTKKWRLEHPEIVRKYSFDVRLKKSLLAAAAIQSAFNESANQTKGETE